MIYYFIGGFLFLSFARYLVLYRLGMLAERKRQQASAYDVGHLIKKCRNSNTQLQSPKTPPQAPKGKSKRSQHKLPLSPVISDSVLVGASVFHQYMQVDDYMYEGVSRISGEQIDNFSDLSSKIKGYAHNSGGLTEGVLNKLKGHIAEEHVAEHLKSAGATVDWPETSNQEGWDLLLNGSKIQVKLVEDVGSSLTEHFKEHSDIAVVIPSDAKNIPNTAFYFDPSEGIKSLTDFLKESPENAVIVDHSLLHENLTESVEQGTDFLGGNMDLAHFPFITALFSSFREIRLLRKNHTKILSSIKNVALDVTGTGIGLKAGATTGIIVGTAIAPGIGTTIGAGVGALAGACFGRSVTNKIKKQPFKEAIEDYKKSTKKLNRIIKQSKKKYENQFNQEQKEEQKKLKDYAYKIKNNIDIKTKNLRRWIADKEKPSEKLKADLWNKVIATPAQPKPSWKEWFWPKLETIKHQIKIRNIKKFLRVEIQKIHLEDRGQLFQKFAEQGLCREFIFSEIQKTEKERLSRENNLIKEVTKGQKQILDKRSESLKKLAGRIKNYVQEIRKESYPYIKEVKNRQNRIKKEAKKLGKKFAS